MVGVYALWFEEPKGLGRNQEKAPQVLNNVSVRGFFLRGFWLMLRWENDYPAACKPALSRFESESQLHLIGEKGSSPASACSLASQELSKEY